MMKQVQMPISIIVESWCNVWCPSEHDITKILEERMYGYKIMVRPENGRYAAFSGLPLLHAYQRSGRLSASVCVFDNSELDAVWASYISTKTSQYAVASLCKVYLILSKHLDISKMSLMLNVGLSTMKKIRTVSRNLHPSLIQHVNNIEARIGRIPLLAAIRMCRLKHDEQIAVFNSLKSRPGRITTKMVKEKISEFGFLEWNISLSDFTTDHKRIIVDSDIAPLDSYVDPDPFATAIYRKLPK